MASWGISSLDVAEVGRSPHSLTSEESTRDATRRDESFASVAIVEDDIYVLRSMDRLLRAAGCRTQTFTSAEEFLGQLNVNVFSCLLLDVRLEGMNGLELQGQLFRSHHKVPIVFVTAVDLEEVKAAALQAGAIAYLPKPVNEGDLLNAVYSALRE
jgi:FixJ family two-component response regulator